MVPKKASRTESRLVKTFKAPHRGEPTKQLGYTFNSGMREQPLGRLSRDVPGDRGDRLAALFDAHADRLYRIARRLVSSRDDALNLVRKPS